jgi:hypothetical protein
LRAHGHIPAGVRLADAKGNSPCRTRDGSARLAARLRQGVAASRRPPFEAESHGGASLRGLLPGVTATASSPDPCGSASSGACHRKGVPMPCRMP